MEKVVHHTVLLVVVTIFLLICHSEQLQSSQTLTLLRIKKLLNFPAILSDWNSKTDFCNSEPTVVCYEGNITQVHLIGEKGAPLLPRNFSIDSFVTTLVRLPDLKVVTFVSLGLWGPLPGKLARLPSLEIVNMSSNFLYGGIPQEFSSLTSLQTLILDDNMLAGRLPDWLSSLPLLTVLSVKKNSFNGSLPASFAYLENLRVLALSHNHFYGDVPDFSRLTNLQVLELEDNGFGPKFPRLGNKLVTLVLSKNRFRSGIPSELISYYQLEWLDLSFNSFVGPFPPALLALPSITYLNIAGNKFTGMLFSNQSCNPDLKFVDLSSNLMTGSVPDCLRSDSTEKVVLYAKNCLSTSKQNQHPLQFCRNEALAVGILPDKKKQKETSKTVLALGIIGGIFGGVALVGLIFLIYRRMHYKAIKKSPTRSITENASTATGYTSKLLSDARYISQTMKTGALGLPGYRTFSLEELEEATNNFNTSAFMGEGSHGQMYRGLLKDGTYVAIRCLKMKRRHGTQNFMHHIELISKLRHRNLVSALGHCFECYLDDSSVSRIFLVFEYVPNGTLRSWISDEHSKRSLTWSQRIAVSIGIAKGIQFLHTWIVPAVYRNNLKITDILLDYNFVAKISSYNLPLLANNTGKKVSQGISSSGSKDHGINARMKEGERSDVYDFGVILLEIIKGGPVKSEKQVDALRDQIQLAITTNREARRSMVDPAVNRSCLDQSLKTMMEVCVKCLLKNPEERPSIEDVLWNLQYAAQVQDAWRGESQTSSEGSPV
ncbi:Tyrosine-protein kinase [Trema orientale]|uniref:Tyrosine-protein kinase n=1 Tax=Trema orientale TaxID=63057 RepID=A0A2P5BE94_TREOI|nr:Tyrosine-protein kinase [Trema orientale]